MTSHILVFFVTGAAFAQTASISGIVRVNNVPAASMQVSLLEANVETKHAETDAGGRYSFTNLTPGPVSLRVRRPSGAIVFPAIPIVVVPGHKFVGTMTFNESGRISGIVTDENKKPLKGIAVRAILAEYAYGALRYTTTSVANSLTNEAGEYTIAIADSERPHYILAATKLFLPAPISDAPPDSQDREPALMPSYFPSAESVDGAMLVTLPPGSRRDLVDIRMRHVPSRCIDGKIRPPEPDAKVTFDMGENLPPLWITGRISPGTNMPAAEGGRFRVCGLHAGDYWIKTFSAADPVRFHGIEYLTIGDKDISGISVGPRLPFPFGGTVTWDGKPPENPSPVDLDITITSPLGEFGWVTLKAQGDLPHRFALPVSDDHYILSIRNIRDGAYLKDVTYAGRSILNEVFQPGSAPAADGLRIVLARDGARVSVRAADKDNNPVAETNIAIIPASALTEASMATAMILAQTSSFGTWQSGFIAPGKYYVIATTTPLNRTPEIATKLWHARGSAEIVDLGPNATAQLTRVPGGIE